MHARQIIRDRAAELLIGATLGTADPYRPVRELRELPVYSGRNRRFEPGELPALAVYARSEQVAPQIDAMPAIRGRELTLTVCGVMAAEDDDDLADRLAEIIEDRICEPGAFDMQQGTIDVRLSTTTIAATDDLERAVRVVALEFAINYRCADGAPSVIV